MIIEDRAKDVDLVHFYHILRRITDQTDFSLTIRQLALLLACYLLGEDNTVRRLAARLGLAKTAVSRMLDHLVVEGLLERQMDPRDRRSVLFAPTPAGNSFLKAVARQRPRAVARLHRQHG